MSIAAQQRRPRITFHDVGCVAISISARHHFRAIDTVFAADMSMLFVHTLDIRRPSCKESEGEGTSNQGQAEEEEEECVLQD